jgi:hypothetical protein
MNHCVNQFNVGRKVMNCNHDETSHDYDLINGEEGPCFECDCPRFRDEAWLQGLEETGGGHNDSDPTYRRAMQDAGRGALLP